MNHFLLAWTVASAPTFGKRGCLLTRFDSTVVLWKFCERCMLRDYLTIRRPYRSTTSWVSSILVVVIEFIEIRLDSLLFKILACFFSQLLFLNLLHQNCPVFFTLSLFEIRLITKMTPHLIISLSLLLRAGLLVVLLRRWVRLAIAFSLLFSVRARCWRVLH